MSVEDDAPLSARYWLASAFNPTRGALLAERIGREAAQPLPPPRPCQAASATPLPPPRSALGPAYARRASRRDFGRASLTAAQLSDLLLPLAARPGGAGRHLASGGAKYPVLAYGALYAVAGLPGVAGRCAWYDPQAHGLVPTAPLPPWLQLAQALGVDWPEPPASVWLLAADPGATLGKYGERGGRFVLVEGGMALGALSLQAAEAGLHAVALGSFHDEALRAALGLAGGEAPLALAALAVGPAP